MAHVKVNVRLLKAGEFLDDIPLVVCPACGEIAFTLGKNFVGDGWKSGIESFAHVVMGLTKTSGEILEFCDYKIKRKKLKHKNRR